MNKKGFTIVESMLSMIFIAGLFLLIGLVTLQMINVYRKGVTLKNVNEVGQLITNDLKRSIRVGDDIKCFIYNGDKFNTSNDCKINYKKNKFVGAGICTGKYTYYWNYGDVLSKNNHDLTSGPIKHKGKIIHLYKILDSNKEICEKIENGEDPNLIKESGKDLIDSGDSNLALYDFSINNKVKSELGDQTFYNISFILGTADNNLININKFKCYTPAELNNETTRDISYCAINKFNFSARAATGKAN